MPSRDIVIKVEKNIKVQKKNLSLCAYDCQFFDNDPLKLSLNEAGCSLFVEKLIKIDDKGFKRCNLCLMAIFNSIPLGD